MAPGDKANRILGEYFTDAGLLNLDDLREASTIARKQNLPIGKVLVMSGYLSKETLQATIEMQAQVKDGQLDYQIALQALTLINKENISLEQALSRLNSQSSDTDSGNRLGEFLLQACLLSNSDLNTAMADSSRCGLPLGRILVNLSMISEPVINNVLNMQSLVRSGKMTKKQAIKALIADKEKQPEGQRAQSPNPVPEGQRAQSPNPAPVADVTPPTNKPGSTGNRITGQFPNLSTLSLHHMLRAAGLIDTASLEKAIQDSLENAEIMTAILKQSGLLDDFVIEAAKQCCQLIGQGQLKPEQAIMALHQCQRTRNSLDDCLLELGWLQSREAVF